MSSACKVQVQASMVVHVLRSDSGTSGSQVLWWDGLGKLTESLGPSEAGELLTVLQDKGVCCRTDVYEVQLAAAAEAAGIA